MTGNWNITPSLEFSAGAVFRRSTVSHLSHIAVDQRTGDAVFSIELLGGCRWLF